jgi:hypothetical protein
MEAVMDVGNDYGTDNSGTDNGTLDKFHLGISADGQSCMMIFLDEEQRAIRCTADFAQFNAFIASLNRAASDMARRRSALGEGDGAAISALNVTFGEFQLSSDDAYIEGALVGESGEILGIRMHPDVACQITRAMLMTAPAASSC